METKSRTEPGSALRALAPLALGSDGYGDRRGARQAAGLGVRDDPRWRRSPTALGPPRVRPRPRRRGLAECDRVEARPIARSVSREVSRNGGELYRSGDADGLAWARAKRPKACVPAKRPRLRTVVAQKLSEDWWPQRTSGGLRVEFTDAAQLPLHTRRCSGATLSRCAAC